MSPLQQCAQDTAVS